MRYSTHARKVLLTFFQSNSNESFSVEEAYKALPELGKSTVYRVVDILEEEGLLRRSGTRSRSVLYQYFDKVRCPHHMHIKCKVCGKTEHLDEAITEKIEKLVGNVVDFEASASTILEGICGECRKERK